MHIYKKKKTCISALIARMFCWSRGGDGGADSLRDRNSSDTWFRVQGLRFGV